MLPDEEIVYSLYKDKGKREKSKVKREMNAFRLLLAINYLQPPSLAAFLSYYR
jgi:hypothetical protein